MEHAHHWGLHLHWFWFIPFLFMILMFVFGCRMFRRAGNWRRSSWRHSGWQPFGCCEPGQGRAERWSAKTPGQILAQRYARGEITKEEYEQMKHDIESSQSLFISKDES